VLYFGQFEDDLAEHEFQKFAEFQGMPMILFTRAAHQNSHANMVATLGRLPACKDNHLIIAPRTAATGTDFNFDQPAHVILDYLPDDHVELL